MAAWRFYGPWEVAGALGVAVAVAGIDTVAAGRFRMSVTGVGLFVGGSGAWAILVGALLCRRPRAS